MSRSTSKVRVLCEDWKVDGVNLLQELAANLVSTAYRPLAYAHLLCVGNHFQRVLGSRTTYDVMKANGNFFTSISLLALDFKASRPLHQGAIFLGPRNDAFADMAQS